VDLTDHNDKGRGGLEDEGETPRPIALDLRGTKNDSRCGNAATEPTAWCGLSALMVRRLIEGDLTVIERGELATPLRGSNFNDIGRSRAGHEGNTETENESTGNELVGTSGGGDDCSSDADDQAAHEHADTATEAVPGRGQDQ
jgi:hypothetical protein